MPTRHGLPNDSPEVASAGRRPGLATTPVGPAEAERLLRGLRHWPLPDGYRGRQKADIAAIADILVRVSWLGDDAGEAIEARAGTGPA